MSPRESANRGLNADANAAEGTRLGSDAGVMLSASAGTRSLGTTGSSGTTALSVVNPKMSGSSRASAAPALSGTVIPRSSASHTAASASRAVAGAGGVPAALGTGSAGGQLKAAGAESNSDNGGATAAVGGQAADSESETQSPAPLDLDLLPSCTNVIEHNDNFCGAEAQCYGVHVFARCLYQEQDGNWLCDCSGLNFFNVVIEDSARPVCESFVELCAAGGTPELTLGGADVCEVQYSDADEYSCTARMNCQRSALVKDQEVVQLTRESLSCVGDWTWEELICNCDGRSRYTGFVPLGEWSSPQAECEAIQGPCSARTPALAWEPPECGEVVWEYDYPDTAECFRGTACRQRGQLGELEIDAVNVADAHCQSTAEGWGCECFAYGASDHPPKALELPADTSDPCVRAGTACEDMLVAEGFIAPFTALAPPPPSAP